MTSPSPDIPADLAAALAARFDLRSTLGRGGMATVYLASDRRNHRAVALKVLRPELAASIGTERFLHEIEIVAQLTHPHILSLHDSGEAQGFVYYVMPFIEGGSLRQRLDHRARMSPDAALAIARPVEDALSYAHRMGVLHRDIKPENILFSQGHPIVADFGIAKAVSSASDTNFTRTGLALGTPGYMSPEQAAGFRDIDERADVYSLAVLVYEMLVGEIPGRWPSEEAVHAGRFLEASPEHRARLAALGAVIEGALVRGLSVRQDQRTASPRQLLEELLGAPPPATPVLPVPRRRFRPDEVDEIVKRASELEVSNPTTGGAMTLGGVEAIAREAGINTELIRSAARAVAERAPAELPAPTGPAPRNRLIGGPSKFFYERVVEGELRDADFPVVVDEIRRVLRNVGQVSQLGRSFSWTMSRRASGRRDLEVSVTVRSGRTRITVQENLGQLMGAVFGGIGGGMGGGGMGPIIGISAGVFHLEPAMFGMIIPFWFATTFAVARTAYYYTTRKRERELSNLIERLDEFVRDLVR